MDYKIIFEEKFVKANKIVQDWMDFMSAFCVLAVQQLAQGNFRVKEFINELVIGGVKEEKEIIWDQVREI